MRLIHTSVVTCFCIAVLANPSALRPTPAAAHDAVIAYTAYTTLQMITCPALTGAAWVNPMAMPPKPSGTQYLLTTTYVVTQGQQGKTKAGMSCSQAASWAKKLIVQKPANPHWWEPSPLRGGPPGYKCTGNPDKVGLAWRGNCLKSGPGTVPSFSWTDD